MNDRFSSGFLLPGHRQIIGCKNGSQKLFTFSVEQLPSDLQKLWQATGSSWLCSLEFEADEDRNIPRVCHVRPCPALHQAVVWTHNGSTVTPVWLSADGEIAFAPSTKHKNIKIWPVKPWPDADSFSQPSTTLWHCDLFFNIADRSDTALYGCPSGPTLPIEADLVKDDLSDALLSYIEQSLLQRFASDTPLLALDLETDGRVVFELGLISSDGNVNELIRRPSRLEGRKLLLKHLQGRTAAYGSEAAFSNALCRRYGQAPRVYSTVTSPSATVWRLSHERHTNVNPAFRATRSARSASPLGVRSV